MSKRGNTEEWAQYVRELGELIKGVRESRNLSQERVAFASGLAKYTFQRIEKGLSNKNEPANPTLLTLVAIANTLEVPLGKILPPRELPELDLVYDGHPSP